MTVLCEEFANPWTSATGFKGVSDLVYVCVSRLHMASLVTL